MILRPGDNPLGTIRHCQGLRELSYELFSFHNDWTPIGAGACPPDTREYLLSVGFGLPFLRDKYNRARCHRKGANANDWYHHIPDAPSARRFGFVEFSEDECSSSDETGSSLDGSGSE